MFHCLCCLLEHRELGVIHLHYDTCYPVMGSEKLPSVCSGSPAYKLNILIRYEGGFFIIGHGKNYIY